MNARGDMADMLGTAQSSGQDPGEHSLLAKMGTQVAVAQRYTLWCCGAIRDIVVGIRQT